MQAGETRVELANLRMIPEGLFSSARHIPRSGSDAPNHEENVSNRCGVKMLLRHRTVLGKAEGDDSPLCRQ